MLVPVLMLVWSLFGAGAAMRSGVIGGAGAGEVRLVLVLDGRVLFCAGAVADARAELV